MNYLLGAVIVVALGAGVWYAWTTVIQGEPHDRAEDHAHDRMDQMEMTAGTNMESTDAADGTDEPADPNAVVVNVSGQNFEFDVKEIRVKEGDTVVINFTSEDGFHDWVVDEFDAATARVSTGNTASVTFVADKAGTYEYYCSIGQHRAQGMVGTLIVE